SKKARRRPKRLLVRFVSRHWEVCAIEMGSLCGPRMGTLCNFKREVCAAIFTRASFPSLRARLQEQRHVSGHFEGAPERAGRTIPRSPFLWLPSFPVGPFLGGEPGRRHSLSPSTFRAFG